MKVIQSFTHQEVTGFKLGYNPFGKPRMYCYFYYIDGLLVDTGFSRVQNLVLAALENKPINKIYVTHHHEDHTGNLNAIAAAAGCPAYASSLCVQTMQQPPAISFVQYFYWGKRPANQQLIAEDQRITTTTNKYHFDIYAVPGHAHDMVVLHEPNRGWLFSADLYIHHHIGYFTQTESVIQQIASTKKILQLDFDVLFCCHNPQLQNGKQQVQKKLQFLEDFYGNVAALYQKGYSVKAISKALSLKERWFIRLLSSGYLSNKNMIRSVIRDIQA